MPAIPGPASKSLGGRYVPSAILVPSPMSEPTPVKYELLRSDRRRFRIVAVKPRETEASPVYRLSGSESMRMLTPRAGHQLAGLDRWAPPAYRLEPVCSITHSAVNRRLVIRAVRDRFWRFCFVDP